ncbi:MAG: endolytic transglycosylase MltG [Coxiellaceae bacterium]|jgi:UPF0755 protein|nr:endolytic transglycosylase MltG [Coxiellaceae bacterium]
MKLSPPNFYLVLVTLLLSVGIGFGFKLWSFLVTPLVAANNSSINFLFTPGISVKKVAYILREKKLIKHPTFFILFVRLSGAEFKLKAGEYIIEPGMTLYQLIQKMIKGDVLRHAFTLVEGWNFSQVISALNNNQYLQHTIPKLKIEEIMAKIGHPGEVPEGRFAPDTYLFSGDVTDLDLLMKAYQLMKVRLHRAWENRSKDVLYRCPYEALIVASLIEKETAMAQEKPIIAGIILRRLEKGLLLQVDPSVIYGIGQKFSGKLTKNDLLKDTPYNTYTRKGLPPTPIAMPSKESIEAALHPVFTNAWYYVAKGDGSHEFSESLDKQKRAIKKYLVPK